MKARRFAHTVLLLALLASAWTPFGSGHRATAESAHPRLFFSESELAGLREKAKTTHTDIWQPILNFAEHQEAPRAKSTADDDIEAYRLYGNRLIALAFACVISEKPDVCTMARTYLLTFANWEQWGEYFRRDLGLGHMVFGNTLAYDWLYSLLTPDERLNVAESLGNRAQKLYEASVEPYKDAWANWWRGSYVQNHYWINHSALGLAGLVLRGEDPRADSWVKRATDRMAIVQYMLNGIGDGSWHESIPYQSYGLTLSLPFLYNLRRLEGTDLIPHTYLRNYVYWRLYNHIPNGVQFIFITGNFEISWGNSYSPQNLLRFAAHEYGDGRAEWLAQRIAESADENGGVWAAPWHVLEFLYYDPSIKAQDPDGLPLNREFPDFEGVIWRTGWGIDDMIFGLKSSPYGGRFAYNSFVQESYPWDPPCKDNDCELNASHDHDDSLSFYIHRAGQWLAPEAEGVDSKETSYHNSILIDGEGQYRFQDEDMNLPSAFADSDGFVEETANSPDFNYVSANATRRYKNIPGITEASRRVVFVRPGYFVMLDNLTADAPHNFEWVSHFAQGVKVQGDWIQGNAGRNQLLGVKVLAPKPFGPERDEDARPYIRIITPKKTKEVRFINVLYPTTETDWNGRPDIALEADTGQAALVRVKAQQPDPRVDDIVIAYGPVDGSARIGPYLFDGHTAVVSVGANWGLQKLFVFGGTSLEDEVAGVKLVSNLDRQAAFEARYQDQTVEVTGEVGSNTRLYAPGADTLLVNGGKAAFSREGDYIVFGGPS